MSDVVDAFLAAQPAELTRAALAERFPKALKTWPADGAAWRALCDELAIPCPEALVRLGDAMAERHIYFGFENHSYSMLSPDRARDERAFQQTLARDFPIVAPYAEMLPLFAQDGDNLLIDREGRIHSLPHDHWEGAACVAENLEAMLARTKKAPINL